jgi:exopolysaccharide biosynthesis polyprenyl glycosylphosphotransferase
MQQRSVAMSVATYSTTAQLLRSSTNHFEAVCASIDRPVHAWWARDLKRLIDITVSAGLLVVLAPLLLAIAIAIRLTSRGPAIFAHTRCGLGGRLFRFHKFRSMVVDAEARKRELLHLNEMEGAAFKITRDPRITRLGRFLRKYSLDELPQLWNVLVGEMSLVGPRPPTPGEVLTYTPRQAQRLSVVPGITGLWQVSGRNSLTNFEQWVELDLAYIKQWSLWLDLRILARTLPVVLRAKGSC